MNNKGFAITSIIYGLMILFVMVVSSFLSILVGRMNRMDELLEGVYETVGYEGIRVCDWCTNKFDEESKTFVTPKKGLYDIEGDCKVYLPKDVVIVRGEIKYPNDEEKEGIFYYNLGGSENLEDYVEIHCIK